MGSDSLSGSVVIGLCSNGFKTLKKKVYIKYLEETLYSEDGEALAQVVQRSYEFLNSGGWMGQAGLVGGIGVGPV